MDQSHWSRLTKKSGHTVRKRALAAKSANLITKGRLSTGCTGSHGARGWDYFKCRRLHALQLRHPRCDCCNKNSLYRGAFFQYPGKKRFSASFGYCAGLRRVNCGLWKTQLPARSRCFQKNPCIIFAKSLAKDWNII